MLGNLSGSPFDPSTNSIFPAVVYERTDPVDPPSHSIAPVFVVLRTLGNGVVAIVFWQDAESSTTILLPSVVVGRGSQNIGNVGSQGGAG
jgi:hypothetical protein